MGWGSQLPSVSRLCLIVLSVDGLSQSLAALARASARSTHERSCDDGLLQGDAALRDQGTDGQRLRGNEDIHRQRSQG
eukprot:7974131-Pyramimonas_sp.AAC.1